ncbi:MAG: L-histidine N(alpha)-methyltransferase [Pyrinomonadaceae bacterium]
MEGSAGTELHKFADDVRRGLTSSPKYLSSRYFYDDEGSRLFQQIMKLPEYYLTAAEIDIFTSQAGEILDAFFDGESAFDLIELGAGDGTKTAILIRHLLHNTVDLTYAPIDISREALDHLTETFRSEFPRLRLKPRHGDYLQVLGSLKNDSVRKKIVMFLGSNIGNFRREQALDFFRNLRSAMNESDRLFIGFDLQKDPQIILDAYDDAGGVTAEFNLNLLSRINREIGADFDVDEFSHYAIYHPLECAARSFLVSRKRQTVDISSLGMKVEFEPWEAIFMEISQKYSLPMIEDMAQECGFTVMKSFFDSRNFYTDSLWRPI